MKSGFGNFFMIHGFTLVTERTEIVSLYIYGTTIV